MNSKEKRSPQIIREYFELLRLRKEGNQEELSNDFINANDSLNWIKKAIQEIEVLTSSCSSSISTHKNELLDVGAKIDRLSNQIPVICKEANNIKEEILKIQAEIYKLSSHFPEKIEVTENSPQLKARKRFILLLSAIKKDLGCLASTIIDLKKTTIYKSIPQILFVFSISALGGFAIVLISQSNQLSLESTMANFGLAMFIFYLIYLFYLYQKLKSIDENYALSWKQQLKSSLIAHRQQLNEKQKISLQKRIQHLIEKLEATKNQYNSSELHRKKLIVYKGKIENSIASESQKIFELEINRQQKEEEYQKKVDELKTQEKIKKDNRLEDLECMIKTWLGSDMKRLTNKFMKKLKIYSADNVFERNVLKCEPILLLIGTTQRTSESVVVESDSDQNLKKYSQDIYIHDEDFKSEPSMDGKSRIYGVYELLIIFLCSNFLSYYKCHWNFIRGKSIGEQTCEYLYDSIVSVKTQEKSSVRLKDEKGKNIYEKRLLLSSKDGKVICFRVVQHKIDRTHSLKLSQMDEAVLAIRDMLRQRRIDVTLIKDVDE